MLKTTLKKYNQVWRYEGWLEAQYCTHVIKTNRRVRAAFVSAFLPILHVSLLDSLCSQALENISKPHYKRSSRHYHCLQASCPPSIQVKNTLVLKYTYTTTATFAVSFFSTLHALKYNLWLVSRSKNLSLLKNFTLGCHKASSEYMKPTDI